MAQQSVNRTRIDQSGQELNRLTKVVEDWLELRRKRDKHAQYHTQLATLRAALIEPLGQLRAGLDGIKPDQPSGEVYASCRAQDKRMMLIRRVWNYFRTIFDQRDDPLLQPVLSAADEVVWSCYSEAHGRASAKASYDIPRVAPLPYIEAQATPEAIRRDRSKPELKPDNTDPILTKYLAKLPIPVVSLPAICISSPWWLVYLAHEVGHHLQYDLAPDLGLVKSFGSALQASAQQEPYPEDEVAAGRWYSWSSELFADVCSIYSVGPAAVHAIAQLELADEQTMLRDSRGVYPAPVMRLALMTRLLDELGLTFADAPGVSNSAALVAGTPLMVGQLNLRQAAAFDLYRVPKAVEAIRKYTLGDLGSFGELYGWSDDDPAPVDTAEIWAEELLGVEMPHPEQTLRAARLIAGGAFLAWTRVAIREDPGERDELLARLAEHALPLLAASREEGTRSSDGTVEPQVKGLGEELAVLLAESIPEGPEG